MGYLISCQPRGHGSTLGGICAHEETSRRIDCIHRDDGRPGWVRNQRAAVSDIACNSERHNDIASIRSFESHDDRSNVGAEDWYAHAGARSG